MWNKAKAILLASNQETNSLYGYKNKSLLFNYNKDGYKKLEAEKEFTQHYHLYIINDDVIKEDWVVWENCAVMKCFKAETNLLWLRKEDGNSKLVDRIQCKKVVVTTDNELGFGDGTGYFEHLPQIPQSFIEQYITEYNKGNIIDEVGVECETLTCKEGELCINLLNGKEYIFSNDLAQELHLPKNRDFKLKINSNNTINIKSIKDSYSREEIFLLFEKYIKYLLDPKSDENLTQKQWIEQNL